MAMGWDTVTIWRREAGGWSRVVATGVRVEDASSSTEALVGPSASSGLKVYFFRDPGAPQVDARDPGCYIEYASPPFCGLLYMISNFTGQSGAVCYVSGSSLSQSLFL